MDGELLQEAGDRNVRFTAAGKLTPQAVDWLRQERWPGWVTTHSPTQQAFAAYWGRRVVPVASISWGGVVLRNNSWGMVDPQLKQAFVEQQQPVDEQLLPGVMRTPTRLWFVRIVSVLVVDFPVADKSGNKLQAVLQVEWHQSPAGRAYSAELQAPLIADAVVQPGSSERAPPAAYIPVGWLLPLEFTVRPFEPANTSIALRRTWQPLSAVGAQPPWPRQMHYDLS